MSRPRISAVQRDELARQAVNQWNAAGVGAADIPDVAMAAGGMFAAVISPDAGALERNIVMMQEQVERYARATWAAKTRGGCG